MNEGDVRLIRRSDGQFVEANLYEGMKPEDLLIVEREWGPVRSQLMQVLLQLKVCRTAWPESLHWDWGKKGPELKLLASAGFGIVCEKKWQGVMLTKTAGYRTQANTEDQGKPLVYIDYIETAPWNWNVAELSRSGEFKGVGSILIRQAVLQSEQEGFHGRVGLHALPQAAKFYEGLGMEGFGPDSAKQNLSYYELSRDAANRLLKLGED